jgi:hypothetical protein
MKRLRIQGSTLRLRSADYKAEVFRRSVPPLLLRLTGPSIHTALRFGELLGFFTGSEGSGPMRTYIYKASSCLTHLIAPDR